MNHELKKAITVYVVIFILIILYFGTLLSLYGYSDLAEKDILNKKITKKSFFGSNGVSYWGFTHFIMYAILGYMLPNCFIPLTIVGILWELFETLMGRITMPEEIKKTRKNRVTGDYSPEYLNWWSGSVKDVVLNSMGFLVGYIIHKIINKNE